MVGGDICDEVGGVMGADGMSTDFDFHGYLRWVTNKNN
jgi:hypothetical protein